MSIKSPNMSLSPTNLKTEKRGFQILRSRTLSSSSAGSNDGNVSGGSQNSNFISPKISPKSIFDRVRKRSQSDVKSSNSVDQINSK